MVFNAIQHTLIAQCRAVEEHLLMWKGRKFNQGQLFMPVMYTMLLVCYRQSWWWVCLIATAGGGITNLSNGSLRVCVWVGALHQNLLCTTLVPIRCNQDPILSDLCLTSFRFVLEFVTASLEHQLHTPPWSASEQNGRLQVFTLTSTGESKTVMTELPDICGILISTCVSPPFCT